MSAVSLKVRVVEDVADVYKVISINADDVLTVESAPGHWRSSSFCAVVVMRDGRQYVAESSSELGGYREVASRIWPAHPVCKECKRPL